MSTFEDGLINVRNQLAQRRSGIATNIVNAPRVSNSELQQLNKLGVCQQIIDIKTTGALDDTLAFESDTAEKFYLDRLDVLVREACRYMLGYGRAVVLVAQPGVDLTKPRRGRVNPDKVRLVVFPGSDVTASDPVDDLFDERFDLPTTYRVRHQVIHWSHLVDFRYVEPPSSEAQVYNFGGISELELIRNEIVNDQIVQRAGSAIIEKNSTVFHKIKGFKEALAANRDRDLIRYYSALADLRSIYGDGIIDSEDDVVSVSQTLSDVADVSRLTLQRLAMVTGIPVPMLVGQAVEGLNSAGTQEQNTLQRTFNRTKSFLIDPINELLAILGQPPAEFPKTKEGTPAQQIEYEGKVIDNAGKLFNMGEDHRRYLVDKTILQEEDLDAEFPGFDDGKKTTET